MSASASKKKRKELEEQGLSASAVAAQKEKERKNKLLRNVLIAVLAVVVCAAAVFGVIKLVNRPSYDNKAAAVTVGEETVSVPIYNYFYNLNASNFYNSYSFLIQAGVPLSKQQSFFGDDGTMEDYLKENTKSTLREILNVCAKAKADGFQLNDDQKANIDTAIESLKAEAQNYGFSNMDKYLHARFGEGCNADNYKQYMELFMTYTAYASKLNEEFQPSAEELKAAYEEDTGAYDLVSFTYATVAAESSKVEPSGEAVNPDTKDNTESTEAATAPATTYTDEAKAAAKEKAEGYTKEMPEDAVSVTYNKSTVATYLNEEVSNWLFEDARKEGDVKVFAKDEKELTYFTVRFDSRETNDYCLVNANIITIQKDKEEEKKDDENASDSKDTGTADSEAKEEQKTAKQRRDALVAAIKDGMSDDEFSKAVTDLDLSVNTNSVSHTYSIDEIREFLFDENRKAGDLFTSYESDTAYYIVRYVSTDEMTYRDTMVKNNLWTKFYEGIATTNEITVDEELLKHAYTDLTFNASSSEG